MALSREVFRHASIYSMAAVLGKAISFLMLPFYAEIFETRGYGLVGMVDAAISLLVSLFGYGSILRYYHEEPVERRGLVLSTGLGLYWMVGSAIVALAMLVARPASAMLLGDAAYTGYLRMSLVTFLLDLTGHASTVYLLAGQRSVLLSSLGLLRLVIGLSLNITLIIVLGWGLDGYFISALVTSLVSSATLHWLVLRECGLGFDRALARKLLAFELPLLPGNLVAFVSRQVERIMVRFQIGLEGVGVLEMAYRFPPLIGMLVTDPFMASWMTKRTEIAEQPGAPQMIGRMFTYFVFVSVFAALLLGVNMQMLLQMLTPPEFWPAAYIARIEIVSLIVLGWYHHVVFGLFHTKRTHTMSLIRGVTSGVKIGISFIFIRTWGLAGAAYSALVASVVQTVWGWYAGQRVYRIDFQYSKVLVLVAAAVGIDLVVEWLQLADSTLVNVLHDAVVGPSFHWLHSTWLGAGEHSIIARLDARTRALTVLAVQTCFCSTYVLLLPFVRRPAR